MLSATSKINVVGDEGTSEVDVPYLFSLVYKTRPFLKEFLFELYHISECVMANDVCHFAWCKELKKDVYHVSICTNVKCKLCIIFRPLILIHSLQCTKLHCSIPFCEVLSLSFSLMISALSQCLGRVSHEHERLPRSRLSHSSLFISFLFSSFHHRLHIASTRFLSLSLLSLAASSSLLHQTVLSLSYDRRVPACLAISSR